MEATLFADDACFSQGDKCAKTLERLVNLELIKLSSWFKSNRLSLNVGKTNFVLLHRKKQTINIQLNINDSPLERKKQIKYLGVIIDDRLNWKAHITYCTAKLGKCLWAITKLRPYTTIHSLRLVYFALAYPFIQYCISSWERANKTSLNPLFVKQKLIVKAMLHKNTYHLHLLSFTNSTF